MGEGGERRFRARNRRVPVKYSRSPAFVAPAAPLSADRQRERRARHSNMRCFLKGGPRQVPLGPERTGDGVTAFWPFRQL